MRVTDYLISEIYSRGAEDIFLVTGGGCMFVTDAIACHGKIRPVPCLHEQAAAMAAVAYAQRREGLGACLTTTGCGGTNAITGCLHAYQENTPVVFISGQCNRAETVAAAKSRVRYIGIQEAQIVPMVTPVTKYAVSITDPGDAVYHIEKALYIAEHGRKGPVWLDIPLDVQETEIDPASSRHFDPSELSPLKTAPTAEEVAYVAKAFANSRCPVIIMGYGVREAGAAAELEAFIHRNRVPVAGTRRGFDLIDHADPLNVGVMDIRGNRAAAFAVQNADLVLGIGAKLGLTTTGYNYEYFARGARTVIAVDIDTEEHKKGTVRVDRVINADAGEFLRAISGIEVPAHEEWVEKCAHWKATLRDRVNPVDETEEGLSMAAFCEILSEYLPENSVAVTDAGASTDIPKQFLRPAAKGFRYIGAAAQGEMGYALPGAIGACVAGGGGEMIVYAA